MTVAQVLATLTELDDGDLHVTFSGVGPDAGWAVEQLAAFVYGDGEGVKIESVTRKSPLGEITSC